MGESVLEFRSVSKRYGDRSALHDVSFELERGEAVGYLGPNGAGKTTTLKLIAGLSKPDAGEVRVCGRDPVANRTEALRSVGALVETPGLPSYLRPRDLLEYVAGVRGVNAEQRARAVALAADRLSLGEHLDRPYGSLSTGLARRSLLAAALVGDPELLVLDEPTLGLDPAAREDLRRLLGSIARSGCTVLVSTHMLEDVESICDRVLFLKDGRLAGDEAVRPDAAGPPGWRTVELRFADPVPTGVLDGLASEQLTFRPSGPLGATASFSGGARAQAELVARLVRAGVPLESVAPPSSDLARRYFETVGRQEAT